MNRLLQELLLEQTSSAQRQIRFHRSISDHSHFIVYCKEMEGEEEIIGYVYVHTETGEYTALTATGEELCPPTTNFSEISKQFEIHARLFALTRVNQDINSYEFPSDNLTANNNQMKNSNNTPAKGKKENQIMFIEYEKPTKDGHFITIVDSYHNTLGRIQKNYNSEAKRYEYTAVDHQGKMLYPTTEKIWELKNQFTDNRTQLLEDAHQRRIESKQNSKDAAEKPVSPPKETDRNIESGKRENDKPSRSASEKLQSRNPEERNQVSFDETEQAIREEELDSLRDREDGRNNYDQER